MSLLSKLLEVLKPVDEDIVKKIVQAVDRASGKVDLAALGADLALLGAKRELPRAKLSSRKRSPTKRKLHAETVRSHAEKLLSALSPTHAFDTRLEFWNMFYRREGDEGPKAIDEYLLFLKFLIHDADQIISEANTEIKKGKKTSKPLKSSPPSSLHSLFSQDTPLETVSWTIAWELAPIFEKHFCKKATASTPSQASKDRTPRGLFVQFVQAIQQNLDVFPGQDAVSPQTIASALSRTKSQRREWAKSKRDEESGINAIPINEWRARLLQGDS